MFVAVMAFFARISDPKIGGTYMTLLNTLCNLGGNWPTTLVLWLVDVLTWRECSNPGPEVLGMNNTCSTASEKEVMLEFSFHSSFGA
jgi:MFS transporter, PAT family, solute carrier family 33 (acetyl-CoA transportor), member 1